MYIEAVNHVPNPYATDDVVAIAASEIESFKEYSSLTAVQFAEAVKDKSLRGGDAFLEQRSKSNLIDRLPLNVRDNMRMYRAARPTVHLRHLAQYAGTLKLLGGSPPSSSTITQLWSPRRVYARNQPRRSTRGHSRESCRKDYALEAPV